MRPSTQAGRGELLRLAAELGVRVQESPNCIRVGVGFVASGWQYVTAADIRDESVASRARRAARSSRGDTQ